jgi:hypothetical protein
MSDIAKPPQPLLPPLSSPPRPVVASQHEWDMLSPEAKASILFSWSEFWFRQTPAASPTYTGSRIVIPVPPTDGETSSTAGWKQAPTAEERESMRDDWKK